MKKSSMFPTFEKLLAPRQSESAGSSRNDRYVAEEVISPAQIMLYQYLLEAFPGQVVLFGQPLERLVSVRHAENRQHAQERLQQLQVDFVICNASGRPLIAFQVDSSRPDEAEAERRQSAIKNRVLSTAGIRLLRLRRSTRELPLPEEFRARVDALLGGREYTGQSDSESMSLSALMGLAAEQQ